jgi:hypothetical protein
MATKSIGTGSRDYTSFASYASYLDGLDTLSEPEIGECYNDGEMTVSSVVTFTGFTTSATNTVTIRPASGHAFYDHADKATNPLRYDQSKGFGINCTSSFDHCFVFQADHMKIIGLQIRVSSSSGKAALAMGTATYSGTLYERCILENSSGGNDLGAYVGLAALRAGTADRLVVILRSNGSGMSFDYPGTVNVKNCTVVTVSGVSSTRAVFRKESGGTVTLTGCAGFGFNSFNIGTFAAGSSHNGSDLTIGFGSSNQQSLTYADQFESNADSTRDFRLKSGAALIDAGTGSDPDIVGQSVSGSARDIGAWEFQSAAGGPFPPFFRFEPSTHLRM